MTTTVLPLRDERSRWRRVQAPVLVAVALLAASVALHVRDPHRVGQLGVLPLARR